VGGENPNAGEGGGLRVSRWKGRQRIEGAEGGTYEGWQRGS